MGITEQTIFVIHMAIDPFQPALSTHTHTHTTRTFKHTNMNLYL